MKILLSIEVSIKQRDLETLKIAIDKAHVNNIVCDHVTNAQRLIHQLQNEENIHQQLQKAIEVNDLSALRSLITLIHDKQLFFPEIQQARVLLDRNENVETITEKLLNANDLITLNDALELAICYGVEGNVIQEAKIRHKEMEAQQETLAQFKFISFII